MRRWRHVLAAAAAAALLTALSGCQSTTKDATVYVKGELDATYLGTYDQAYIDVVKDMTEDDAKEQYENNVKWEAEILVENFLSVEYPTDEVTQRSEELIKEIYSHAKYTVADAEKLKSGDIAVEVTISPIEILSLLTDEDFYDALEESGYADAVTEEETAAADAAYAMLMLDKIESLLPQLSYGEDQIIMLQMKKDSDGYYSLVESGWQKLDEVMIDYNGTYAK